MGKPPEPPNRQQVTADMLQNELVQERNRAASATLFTGGSGALDQPTVASRTLLGA